MNGNSSSLGRASSSFALAAALAILFNTALAWAKDAYHPLNDFMTKLSGHHWTTHAIADLLVFFGLGLIFFWSGQTEKIAPNRLITFLIVAVVAGAGGLVGWYLVY